MIAFVKDVESKCKHGVRKYTFAINDEAYMTALMPSSRLRTHLEAV